MDVAIVLYTISDDTLRNEFAEELQRHGFEPHPDQSTFTYPMNKVGQVFDERKFTDWLERWSKNKKWSKTDFVSLYYLSNVTNGSNFSAIKNQYYSL